MKICFVILSILSLIKAEWQSEILSRQDNVCQLVFANSAPEVENLAVLQEMQLSKYPFDLIKLYQSGDYTHRISFYRIYENGENFYSESNSRKKQKLSFNLTTSNFFENKHSIYLCPGESNVNTEYLLFRNGELVTSLVTNVSISKVNSDSVISVMQPHFMRIIAEFEERH